MKELLLHLREHVHFSMAEFLLLLTAATALGATIAPIFMH